jgi:hypothetical protein
MRGGVVAVDQGRNVPSGMENTENVQPSVVLTKVDAVIAENAQSQARRNPIPGNATVTEPGKGPDVFEQPACEILRGGWAERGDVVKKYRRDRQEREAQRSEFLVQSRSPSSNHSFSEGLGIGDHHAFSARDLGVGFRDRTAQLAHPGLMILKKPEGRTHYF